MKKRDIPVYAVLHFLNFVIAGVAAKLFANIAVKILDLFIEVDFFVGSVVHMAVLFLVFFGLLAFLAYKGGYREGVFDSAETLMSVSVASLVHFLLGLLLSFTPWLFGAVRDASGFFSMGVNYNDASRVDEIPFALLCVMGVAMELLSVAISFVAGKVGVRARLRDRDELMGEKNL